MIEIIEANSNEVEVEPAAVAVYLGYYGVRIDCQTQSLIEECTSEFINAASFKACLAKVKISGDEQVDLGFLKTDSSSLAKNLRGCSCAYILAATTGFDSQRLIERASLISPLRGIVTDCIGSAAIEAFCDKINLSLDNPEFLRPRFSPGYGDLPLEYQRDITQFLNTKKNIGMSLTDSLMLVPSKSVTAIIGIGKEKNKCTGPGCMICDAVNCPYRD